MDDSVEDFEPIFGTASGKVEGRETSALLPFVFRLHGMDPIHLSIVITDFHDHTWQTVQSIEQLNDLRDEIGIGGSWRDFLAYIRDAFLSDHVILWLGGPASTIGGYGATSAKVTAQKSRGTPRVSLKLAKLGSADVNDVFGDIGVQLCRKLRTQSLDFARERERSLKLSIALDAEKEANKKLQVQIDTIGFTGKKKWRGTQNSQSFMKEPEPLSSQFPGYDLATTSTVALSDDIPNADKVAKAKQSRSKVKVAPTSMRAKRRGTAIGDDEQ